VRNEHDRLIAALPAYEIGEELGRGAWGVVVAARHRQLGRQVAIKELPRALAADPGVRVRFVSEARLLATLDHPHVVPIYDFVEQNGLCLLVMERLAGGTVRSRLQAGDFTIEKACAVLLAVSAGLHHAHERGVLHRDVKPENLMFASDETVKIADFGIAKVIGGSATLATRSGEILGTPAYIAPEQARGAELGPATDVYAAGTILYELLSGKLPFPGDANPATVLYQHVYEQPAPLLQVAPSVPPGLAQLIDRALASSPSDRYASAEEFGVAIAEFAAGEWGPDWLRATNIPLSDGGHILEAALGERRAAASHAPNPLPMAPPNPLDDMIPEDLVPIHLMIPEDLVPIHLLHEGLSDSEGSNVESKEDEDAVPTPPAAEAPAAEEPSPIPSPTPTRVDSLPTAGSPSGGTPVWSGRTPTVSGVPKRTHKGRYQTQTPRRPRRLLTAILAVLVAGAAAGVTVVVLRKDNHRATTAGSRPTVPPSSTPPTSGPPGTPSAWVTAASAPTATQQVGAAYVKGRLYVVGGLTETTSATAEVDSFDPTIGNWAPAPPLPMPLHHLAAVAYNGELVVLGGWIPRGPVANGTASDHVLALRNGQWVELPKMGRGRAAAAAAVVGNKLIVTGGQADNALVPTTEVFDGSGWKDVAPMLTLRDHLAAVADDKYFYAVGGRVLGPNHNLGAVERYDPSADQWQKLPDMLTPRGGLGAALVGNQIVTVGGEALDKVFATVEAFDLIHGTWSALPPMHTPRHGMAVLAVGKAVYAVDGAAAINHTDSVTTNEVLGIV
jgi:serine/threonine protein kinase